ncbi:MAG TPA: hypothetical protein VLH84_04995 [Patescibacteria group bacterium]|nr:hypothetical protein [Patescibacteria group bacterium]
MKYNSLLATGLSVVLLAGCDSARHQQSGLPTPASSSPNSGPVLSPAEKQIVKTDLARIQEYWRHQTSAGAGRAATAQVVIVEGFDVFHCTPNDMGTSSISPAHYCAEKNTIVVPAFAVLRDLSFPPGRDALDFELAHEDGHAKRAGDPKLAGESTLANETGATCLAGKAMANAGFNPADISAVVTYLTNLPVATENYGSGAQQAAAYRQGATGGNC